MTTEPQEPGHAEADVGDDRDPNFEAAKDDPALWDDAERARRLHERTGEIELLISGALVYGLFQLLGWIRDVTVGLEPSLGETQYVAVLLLSIYVRLIVLTLLLGFVLHLVTRAYWIGLIGLDSVFPEGIYWDRINYGPVAKRTYRGRVPRLAALARAADDVGSSIFSFSFWVSVVFVWTVLFGALVGLVWMLLESTVLPGVSFIWFFAPAVAVVAVPSLAIGVDKVLEGRVREDGRVAAGIQRSVAFGYWLMAGPLFMPIQFTLFSRVPKKYMWPLFLGVMVSLTYGFVGTMDMMTEGTRIVGTDLYPERPGPRTILDGHYATRRSEGSLLPYIQAPVIEDSYIELSVPLTAIRLEARREGPCEGFEGDGAVGVVRGSNATTAADPAYERALLACLGRIWTVRLNGAQLAVEWDLMWTAGRGATGIIGYIDAEDLQRGAHVLELREVAAYRTPERLEELEARGEEPPQPSIYYIRFRS